MIRLKALGGLAVERDGHIATDVSVGRRALTLLALIACAEPPGIARTELAALFWPGKQPKEALQRLRAALHDLRHRLGTSDLFVGRRFVQLNPDRITSDILEFQDAVDSGRYGDAVAVYSGQLLDGVEDPEQPELAGAIRLLREELYSRFRSAAELLAESHDRAGEHLEAVALWRRLAAAEPFSPHYAMGLVRSLALAGDRTGALQFARVYETLMREELHSAPSAELLDYADALRRGEDLHHPPTPQAEGLLPITRPVPIPAVPHATAERAMPDPITGEQVIPRSPDRSTPAYTSGEFRRRRQRKRRWPLALAVVGPLAIAWVITTLGSRAEPAILKANRVAVLPCELEGSDARARDACTRLLEFALAGSDSLEVVDRILVTDRVQRADANGRAGGLRVARDLGAAHAIFATVSQPPHAPTIQASLYRVSSGRPVRTRSVTLPADSAAVPAQVAQLVSELMAPERPGDPTVPPRGKLSSRSWTSLQRGLSAVAVWDLAIAAAELRDVLEAEPTQAAAAYWLAQVEFWRAELPVEERLALATEAARLSPALPERERRQAAGLAHLVRREWPQACEEYDGLLTSDSLNVVAWFGRAECHARDDVVVRDPSSRTGWSFRASRGAAVQSYHRALTIVPSAFRMYAVPRFSALRLVYPTNPNAAIVGRLEGAAVPGFIAFPELRSDTLALTPVPIQPAEGITDPQFLPDNRQLAARRAIRLMRDFTTRWVDADSNNPQAHEAHALALEENGEVRATLSGNNALWHVRRALELLDDSDEARQSLDALRLHVAEVRLLLKNERYGEVHDMASTILATATTLNDSARRVVLPLASLLGRMALLDTLVHTATPGPLGLRPDLRNVPGIVAASREHELLLAHVIAGMPSDTLAARLDLLNATLAREIPASERARVTEALYAELRHHGSLYLPAIAAAVGANRPAERLQDLLRSGDLESAAQGVAELIAEIRQSGSGAMPSDWLLISRIALAQGDTLLAAEMLELGLEALPRTSTNILSLSAVAAAVPALAALRVQIGEAAGQPADATAGWTQAFRELRRTADPVLFNAAPR